MNSTHSFSSLLILTVAYQCEISSFSLRCRENKAQPMLCTAVSLLSQVSISLSLLAVSRYSSLINLLLVSCLSSAPPPTPIPLCTPLSHPILFLSHAVALLCPGHKVAVGDIVKVTNGQHLPADMVIVSSRLDTVCVCVSAHWYVLVCAYVLESFAVCVPIFWGGCV